MFLNRKFIAVGLMAAAFSFAGFPKDNPMKVREGNQDEVARMLEPYLEMSKRTFPEVKKKYLAGVYQKERRVLQVQIKLTDKDGRSETPFVKVISCKGDFFKGTINNNMNLVREYAYGDTVSFMQNEIVNWVVQDAEGNEEGNFVGKAIDVYHYKKVGIIFEVVYQKGEFKLKYVQSVVGKEINVDGILSKDVIDQAADLLKKIYRKKLSEGNAFEENKKFYTYHVYDFVNKKFVE